MKSKAFAGPPEPKNLRPDPGPSRFGFIFYAVIGSVTPVQVEVRFITINEIKLQS